MLVLARSSVITRKKFCYHSQEVLLSLARSSVITRKKFCFIHFHLKMRNHTASLFRGLQPPIPHMRAHGKTCKNNMVV
ncbi:hypothetical protein EGW01_08430 [Helicobacter pylori]|uniref:Uncharacterized protein n=1 Tax=Helicobacter pylori TaxID=210 RepID=A0A3N5CVK0_HELPX|nr:hypothetical protein EGW01_08430 [Helicobacter pylori]